MNTNNLINENNNKIILLPTEKISPNPYQPRKSFNQENLRELSENIKIYGVIQPITVRLISNGNYELVTGERRLRACKLANQITIPSIIINITDKDSSFISIIENLQRENLNFIEEALGYENLLRNYNLTQEELAKKIGKGQSTIANKLRILKLSHSVQEKILKNNLTERHARALLKITNPEEQLNILDKIIKNNLNVIDTENLITNILKINLDFNNPKNKRIIKRSIKDIRLFTNTIKQAVEIMNHSGINTNYNVTENSDGYEIIIKIKNSDI